MKPVPEQLTSDLEAITVVKDIWASGAFVLLLPEGVMIYRASLVSESLRARLKNHREAIAKVLRRTVKDQQL